MPRVSNASLLGHLADAALGIESPFVCGGTLEARQPLAVRFINGDRSFELELADSAYRECESVERLVRELRPARFGKGRRTLRDESVRDGLQVNCSEKPFVIDGFEPSSTDILEQIRTELLPNGPQLIAELYSLNVYGRDGHFRPHKDTPHDDTVGTLVVCLPSHFSAGELVVVHRGAYRVFDWGRVLQERQDSRLLQWAAFFGDVDHAIERVWAGKRITATWLLKPTTNEFDPVLSATKSDVELFRERFADVLERRSFYPGGVTLGFPCFHMYSQERDWQGESVVLQRSGLNRLKGRDRSIASVALEHGCAVRLAPYIVEDCADEVWQLERLPTPKERSKLGKRLTPTALEQRFPFGPKEGRVDPGIKWVIEPPNFNGAPHLYAVGRQDVEPIFAEVPSLEYLHACEFSHTGYFGNEGSPLQLYLYAALLIEVPPFDERAPVSRR